MIMTDYDYFFHTVLEGKFKSERGSRDSLWWQRYVHNHCRSALGLGTSGWHPYEQCIISIQHGCEHFQIIILWLLVSDEDITDEESLFHPARRKSGAKDVECQRISQVFIELPLISCCKSDLSLLYWLMLLSAFFNCFVNFSVSTEYKQTLGKEVFQLIL